MKRDMQRPEPGEDYPEEDYQDDYGTSVTIRQPKPVPTRPLRPDDPSNLGYPATLPIEVALKTDSIQNICKAYDLSREQWQALCKDKSFQEDFKVAQGLVAEGFGFKLKAAMQADALLKTSWEIIHDRLTPPNVKADLIKSTIKWAGHDAPAQSSESVNGFQININFTKPNEPRVINGE